MLRRVVQRVPYAVRANVDATSFTGILREVRWTNTQGTTHASVPQREIAVPCTFGAGLELH